MRAIQRWKDRGLGPEKIGVAEAGDMAGGRLQEIYRQFGYFAETVVSNTYPGKEGAEKMSRIMKTLRENPPGEIGGSRVAAIRDYLKGIRTQDGKTAPLDSPPSDVLYFELDGSQWLCARPSGTEPKIKYYILCKTDVPAAGLEKAKAQTREKIQAIEADIRKVIG